MNPLGDVIAAQAVTNKKQLLDHLWAKQPTTVTVLDGVELALQIKAMLPNCIVVARFSDFEPQPGTGYLQQLTDFIAKQLSRFGKDFHKLSLMVNCEQSWTRDRMGMWADMIEMVNVVFPQQSLVVGNVASGLSKCGQGKDPNDWSDWPESRRLFYLLDKFRQHYLAVHEYTSFFPWLVSNDAWGDPFLPPSIIDWLKNQWHLGRNIQGIMRAIAKFNLDNPKAKIAEPNMLITEGFFDDMQDVAKAFPGYRMGGWMTYRDDFWKKKYTGKQAEAFFAVVREFLKLHTFLPDSIQGEELLAFFHIWIWEYVYGPLKFVKGAHVFIWQDASGRNQWADDRTDQAYTYQQHMEHYHPVASVPNPSTEPPKDDEATQPIPVPTIPDPDRYIWLTVKIKIPVRAFEIWSDMIAKFRATEIHISQEEIKE